MMGSMMMWWWILGGLAVMLLVWILLRDLVRGAELTADDSPEAILARRYARGEIDDEEYHRRLDDIRYRAGAR